MDFELSEEHRIFREAIREFAEKEIGPLVEEAEETETFPVQIFPRMGELGYLCIRYPEEYGAAGVDKLMECLYVEELGRVCLGIASGILVHSSVATLPVAEFGTEEQKQKYLVPAVRGEKIGAFGLTEPDAGSDAAGIKTTAKKDGDMFILNGAKTYITNGTIADFFVIAAYTDKTQRHKGIALFLVERGTPGFSADRKLKKMGLWSSDLAELTFEDCPVPEENILGEETGGFVKLAQTLTGGRMAVGARAVGLAQAAYEAALKYAKERTQFGQTIGSFQVIQHKLADMAMAIDAARLLVYRAAWLYDNGKPYIKEASMAKLNATEMAVKVVDDAIQIHGGIGFMMESPVQRYYRDAKFGMIVEGTSEIQRNIIAKHLGLGK
jgi:alkylation response protein AidB-like acyl-CoA dehydrogenase